MTEGSTIKTYGLSSIIKSILRVGGVLFLLTAVRCKYGSRYPNACSIDGDLHAITTPAFGGALRVPQGEGKVPMMRNLTALMLAASVLELSVIALLLLLK